MKSALIVLVLFVLTYGGLVVAQDLPDAILADQYLLEATRAAEEGNIQAAIRAFEKIESLEVEPPMGRYLFSRGQN